MKIQTILVLIGVFVLSSCGDEGAAKVSCEEVLEVMNQCYPGVKHEGGCNDQTYEVYEQFTANGNCEEIVSAGKADLFSFNGCDKGFHVCGGIFCCEDYNLEQSIYASWDWDFTDIVDTLDWEVPVDVDHERKGLISNAIKGDSDALALLDAGKSFTYIQEVREYKGQPKKEMAVEISMQTVKVGLDDFLAVIPAERWGVELDLYLGGQVIVMDTNDKGLATKQVERMVLSPPFPVELEVEPLNLDMSKGEYIYYEDGRAIVYWRVMYSHNKSTEADVGSVEFRAINETTTLVTFHSAHRLNALGIHIPNDIVKMLLDTFFLRHTQRYKDIVESAYGIQ